MDHDDFCEADFIAEAGAHTPCGCSYRSTRGLVEEHDRRVKAEAWNEGFYCASDGEFLPGQEGDGTDVNPYELAKA